MKLPTNRSNASRFSAMKGSAIALAVGCLSLSACGSTLPGLPEENTQHEQSVSTEDLPMKPAPSPDAEGKQAMDKAAGTVDESLFSAADVAQGTAADFRSAAFGPLGASDTQAIGVLVGSTLLIAAPGDDQATKVDLPGECSDISTSGSGVATACGNTLIEWNAEGKRVRAIETDTTVATGTFTDEGRAAIAKKGKDKVYFYDASGAEVGDDIVSKDLDRAVVVNPHDGPQRIALIDRTRTSINDVSPTDGAYNAALRIGQGVGQVVASFGDDGVIVASDTRQDQVLIYTMNDVVRLHQAAPTGGSPYAVAWDSTRSIAWVSTTSDNAVTGFDISTGVPVEVARFNTIPNVAAVYATKGGTLTLIGKNGAVQTIEDKDVKQQVGAATSKVAERYPITKVGGE